MQRFKDVLAHRRFLSGGILRGGLLRGTQILGLGLAICSLPTMASAQQPAKGVAAQAPEGSNAKEDNVPKVTDEKPMNFWMAKKLEYSKLIIESLTKGDFEKLSDDAVQMRLIGKLEGFVKHRSPNYRLQLQSFDLANQELIRQANRRSAEGATLAFNQLTSSCVTCHGLLREGVE